MNPKNYHSLFLIPDHRRNIFNWSVRWMNEKYPKLKVTFISSPKRALHLLSKQTYFRIYWFGEECVPSRIIHKIRKHNPDLEWMVLSEQLDVICFRKWRALYSVKGIWYLSDFLSFDLWSFILSSNTPKEFHSPTVEAVLKNPELEIEPKDLRLLKAIQVGKLCSDIEKTIGFSKSNYYYRLERLKKQFELLPEASDYKLIKTAENWGYLPENGI